MMLGLGAVTTTHEAPPIFCRASAASSLLVSMYALAPSLKAKSFFESLLEMATVLYPILREYWRAK